VRFRTANIALLEASALRVVRAQGYEAFGAEQAVSGLAQSLDRFSLDAEAVASREAIVVPDTREDPRWVFLPETAWIRVYLAVPICLRGQVLGLLRFDGDEVGSFTAEDARRLEPLANAAAAALENARLHETAQRELDERRDAEDALKKSEVRLREVLAAPTNVSFITSDVSGAEARILDFGPGAERMFGYPREEIVGKPVSILLVPEDAA
jgi:PAS domain-containing protein